MHLPMKGKRYADVEAIQKACTGILEAIPGNELKHSFDLLLDRCALSVVQTLLGAYAGVTLLVHSTWQSRLKRWLLGALLLGLLGGALCGFSRENGIIPVNKNLWSLSFVFVTVALALLLLSLLYYVIYVRQWCSGYPFTECGMNAIIMYVGHTVMHRMLP
ncbi:heparan-alpha-glucosaminide N-acetyltransferase-like [Drosophila nasuta]|uniref:heparan-alpha-glucosaminide N-acetyltransferase-like n=1 Tax=Drosophila nasuta TaxID=42062 RepID=UPI00295E9850|nr:heparan-alpha-glucosaminide N-acetyltransferase-like [Drosophila nasuta]